MKSLRLTITAAITAALLTLGLAGPAAAATRDTPDSVSSGGATAVEYGLIVGLIAV